MCPFSIGRVPCLCYLASVCLIYFFLISVFYTTAYINICILFLILVNVKKQKFSQLPLLKQVLITSHACACSVTHFPPTSGMRNLPT